MEQEFITMEDLGEKVEKAVEEMMERKNIGHKDIAILVENDDQLKRLKEELKSKFTVVNSAKFASDCEVYPRKEGTKRT